MGTTGVYMDMASTKKMILKDMDFTGLTLTSKVLSHGNGRGGMWILREIHVIGENPFTTATFVKMGHKDGETYYKEMDIDCHPYFYDCPQSWLARIQPQGQMGMDWLDKAQNYANMMKMEIKAGMQFKYNWSAWTTEYKYSSQKWACRTSQGKLYLVRNASIKENMSLVAPTI